jgi:hypothetical protein
VDTGLSGLALRLFGGDVPEGGMEPLTIVVSFDVGEQVALGSIACWIADLVNKFGFHGSKVALHGALSPAISLPAHGLDETAFGSHRTPFLPMARRTAGNGSVYDEPQSRCTGLFPNREYRQGSGF